MARAAQIYTLSLSANQAQVLLVDGGYYKILSAYGNVSVSREGGSIINPMKPGQGEKLNFKRLTIQDVSGAANVVEIIIADESFVDDRISGEVSVIDGGFARTMAEQAYTLPLGCAAVAGQYAHVQLWNSSSNVNDVMLESFTISSSGAATVSFIQHSGALANLNAQSYGVSKKLRAGYSQGAGYSYAQSRYQNAAAVIGAGPLRGYYQTPANQSLMVKLSEPIVIPPNRGMNWYIGNILNTDLFVTCEVYERAASL